MAHNNRLIELLDELRDIVTTPQQIATLHPSVPSEISVLSSNTAVQVSNSSGQSSSLNPRKLASTPVGYSPGRYPTPPSHYLNEARRLFAHYPTAGRVVSSGTGRPTARNQRAAVLPAREWTKSFCCLSNSGARYCPNTTSINRLNDIGLGQNIVTLDFNGSSESVRSILIQTYPKLQDTEFEILKSAGSYGRRRDIIRVCANQGIPSVSQLRSVRSQVFYIRPMATLDPEEDSSELNGMEDDTTVLLTSLPVTATQTMPIVQPQTEVEDNPNGLDTSVYSQPLRTNSCSVASATGETFTPSEYQQGSNIGSDDSNMPFESETKQLVTLEDFREQVYLENQGTQTITMKRDDFLLRVFGLFKNPSFPFYKKPFVEFSGEPGNDVGAVTKEFFWKALTCLYKDRFEGRIPLFDGSMDHLLPSTDISLLQLKIFKYIGMFMAYSGLHSGISFIGLSEAAVEYLMMDTTYVDTPIKMTIDDISDMELRNTINLMSAWHSGSTISEDDMLKLKADVVSYDYSGYLTVENAHIAAEQLMYHHVIGKRKAQLDMIKDGFRGHQILEFVLQNQYLTDGLFPRESVFEYSSAFVISKIDYTCSPTHFSVLSSFIRGLDGGELRKLVQAWIG